MSKCAPKPGKNHEHNKRARSRSRRPFRPELVIESLEHRVLLAVTVSYSDGALAFTDPASLADNLTLRVDAGNVEYSTDGANYTQTQPISALSSITVQLGDGNDTLTVDPTLSGVLAPDNITISDLGGTGQNTLASLAGASDPANTWDLAFPGGGTLDGRISFLGVNALDGGDGTDSFVLGAAMRGSGSGMTINAGLGTATLDYSAYTAPVSVNLASGTATDLASVINITNVTGGAGLNSITGGSRDSVITAGPGDNDFTAGTGLDTFVFNADADHGSAQIFGGTNASTATLDFSPTQKSALNLDLASTTPQNVTPDLSLLLEPGNTVNNVIGGAGANTITANSGNDDITAGIGINVLTEGTGDDTFTVDADVDAGSVHIVGATGDGAATLDFSPTQNTAVTVDLSSAGGAASHAEPFAPARARQHGRQRNRRPGRKHVHPQPVRRRSARRGRDKYLHARRRPLARYRRDHRLLRSGRHARLRSDPGIADHGRPLATERPDHHGEL